MFSGLVLAVIAIPGLVLAAAIRLESEGNPFYSQIRVGQTHRDGSLSTFRMWKFRSMFKDADKRLVELKGAERDRRRHVQDEGRPARHQDRQVHPQALHRRVPAVPERIPGPDVRRRPAPASAERGGGVHRVRPAAPGREARITGWWQVTERNSTGFDGMVRRDLEYIANRGIFTDLKIVVLTGDRGHHRQGCVLMLQDYSKFVELQARSRNRCSDHGNQYV